MLVFVSACSSTRITEYNADGKINKVTVSNESAFAIAAQSIKTKDNILHASGWTIGVQPSTGIYGIGAFEVFAGSINAETGRENAMAYASMINAAKISFDITANNKDIAVKSKINDVGNSNTNFCNY